MKALLDENLPPSFAKALDAFSAVTQCQVCHSSEIAARGTDDVSLFAALAAAGIRIHVTQDQHNRRPIERCAIADAGLVVFVLQRSWSSQPFWNKATQLVRWWPQIVAHAERMQPPAMFRVPWKPGGKGKFEQIPMR